MSEFQNTNLKVLVANATTAAGETTLSAFKSDADVGEVIAVEGDGEATAATSNHIIVAIKRADGTIDESEKIPVASITKASVTAFVAPENQVEYVGYNGTDGAIDVINNNLYEVLLEFKNFGSLSPENRYRKQGFYKSTTSASQQLVAEGMRDSLIRNFSREPENNRLLFEVVSSGATTANTGTGDLTVENGSKTVVAATDVDAVAVVGDFIRFGTTTDSPVYRITAIDATAETFKLDVAYQGETGTVIAADYEFVTEADAAAGDFGIKMTGKNEDWKLGIDEYSVLSWRTSLVDFGTTEVTLEQAAIFGLGNGQRVREREWFGAGNFGDKYRLVTPDLYDPYNENLQALAANSYNVVTISYSPRVELFQDVFMPRSIEIWCNADTGTDFTSVNGLVDQLNNATKSPELEALTALA